MRMTHCIRCGRTLKAPTATGLGPTCERYVMGSKPRRAAKAEVKRDPRTKDLFEGIAVMAEDASQAVRRGFRAARERLAA
jgi:hypothetical protein